jgi:acylphosphatase
MKPPMDTKLLYRIRVTGHVQGVGFRWNAAREAWKREITGYVKNMPDGSVYIEAEGYPEQLNSYLDWCRKGPGAGFVASVQIDTLPAVNYTEFSIEH